MCTARAEGGAEAVRPALMVNMARFLDGRAAEKNFKGRPLRARLSGQNVRRAAAP